MNNLKKLRLEKNLTVEQVSKLVDIPRSTLTLYENNKRQPRKKIWEKLSQFYNVDTAYIMGLTTIRKLENVKSNRIKEYRIQRNLSLDDLSKLTNIPISKLEDYENEITLPENPKIWEKLSSTLSIPVEYLVNTGTKKNYEIDSDALINSLKRKDVLVSSITSLDYGLFSEFSNNFLFLSNILINHSKLSSENKNLTDNIMNLFITWFATETKIIYFQENALSMTEEERSFYMKNNFSSENWEIIYKKQKQLISKLIPLLNNQQ